MRDCLRAYVQPVVAVILELPLTKAEQLDTEINPEWNPLRKTQESSWIASRSVAYPSRGNVVLLPRKVLG